MIKKRYVALIEYDGSAYSGWQRQPFLMDKTIQGQVEKSLTRVAAHEVEIVCAGRTDAGVHAIGQVIHFDTTSQRDDYAWLAGTNRYLPKDIRLKAIQQIDAAFHARYDAVRRQYRYIILNTNQPSAIWHKRCYWHAHKLNITDMQLAANSLIGEHDFSAFRAAECQAHTANRFIEKITVSKQNAWIYVDVVGNAFLHHMVRNIVGSLLMVGDGRRTVEWLESVLVSRDRRQAGPTAPAFGLYFYAVEYQKLGNIFGSDAHDFPL